jgi:ribonuclease BN (tRNA processing enzyme)
MAPARAEQRRLPRAEQALLVTAVRFLGSGDSFGSGGRLQTCIMVDGARQRFVLDCGASSLIAMRAQGIEPNSIDAILLTHFHGDHCAGVPFVLMDAMLGSKRTKPIVIAGPPGTAARMDALREVLFPGSHVMKPKFEVDFIEMEPWRVNEVHGLRITPYPALHTPETAPTILRVEVDGKVVTYTGDTEWTDALITAADGADLFISECYYYEKRIKMHMNYMTLRAHLGDLRAKAIVLTHMSEDMLQHAAEVPELCATDGMIIAL